MLDKLQTLAGMIRAGRYRKAVLSLYVFALRQFYGALPNDGVAVMEEDWDCLVVLDACRYDYFERMHSFDGRLEKRTSRASATEEWVLENFSDRYDDVVYVSANPRISDHSVDRFRGTDHFAEVVNVWEYAWDSELNTVPAEAVTDAALAARERHPGKRLIVHYVQPHAPWIGETKLDDRTVKLEDPDPDEWIDTGKTWGTMLNRGAPLSKVTDAYEDNVRVALEETERLVEHLPGRIVITSDHGEAFGEKFIIEHPPGVHIDELVEVPWCTVPGAGTDQAEPSKISDAVRRVVEKHRAKL